MGVVTPVWRGGNEDGGDARLPTGPTGFLRWWAFDTVAIYGRDVATSLARRLYAQPLLCQHPTANKETRRSVAKSVRAFYRLYDATQAPKMPPTRNQKTDHDLRYQSPRDATQTQRSEAMKYMENEQAASINAQEDKYIAIWTKAIETQMHFNELPIRNPQAAACTMAR